MHIMRAERENIQPRAQFLANTPHLSFFLFFFLQFIFAARNPREREITSQRQLLSQIAFSFLLKEIQTITIMRNEGYELTEARNLCNSIFTFAPAASLIINFALASGTKKRRRRHSRIILFQQRKKKIIEQKKTCIQSIMLLATQLSRAVCFNCN